MKDVGLQPYIRPVSGRCVSPGHAWFSCTRWSLSP